jgi:hypothetical protein
MPLLMRIIRGKETEREPVNRLVISRQTGIVHTWLFVSTSSSTRNAQEDIDFTRSIFSQGIQHRTQLDLDRANGRPAEHGNYLTHVVATKSSLTHSLASDYRREELTNFCHFLFETLHVCRHFRLVLWSPFNNRQRKLLITSITTIMI